MGYHSSQTNWSDGASCLSVHASSSCIMHQPCSCISLWLLLIPTLVLVLSSPKPSPSYCPFCVTFLLPGLSFQPLQLIKVYLRVWSCQLPSKCPGEGVFRVVVLDNMLEMGACVAFTPGAPIKSCQWKIIRNKNPYFFKWLLFFKKYTYTWHLLFPPKVIYFHPSSDPSDFNRVYA